MLEDVGEIAGVITVSIVHQDEDSEPENTNRSVLAK